MSCFFQFKTIHSGENEQKCCFSTVPEMFDHLVKGQCVQRCAAFAIGRGRQAESQCDQQRQYFEHL